MSNRTITIHHDGTRFIVMKTDNSIIKEHESIEDIDLKVPDEWKKWIKAGKQ